MKTPDIQVIFSDPFTRDLKRLQKAYRNVKKDLISLVLQLENGDTPGNRLQNLVPYDVFKVRLSNRDAQRGKNGGYRVIYYVRTAETVFMVAIYSKSDQDSISDAVLRQILDEIEASMKPDE